MISHGFFGKLPTVGDFVSRGWRAGTREGLNKLLDEAVAALVDSTAHGKELISQAPCVALSIRPGVVGAEGLEVLVLPSRDRVGRSFPLCVGVQWTEDEQDAMGWPSHDYALALIARVQRSLDTKTEPDALVSDLATLGSPRQFRRTFHGLTGDDTRPRLGADTPLLRIPGPMASMSSTLTAVCTMLPEASDLLGFRLDDDGEVQDFFVCRKIESGAALASAFDGRWAERGWATYRSPLDGTPGNAPGVINVDDDATCPGHPSIDIDAMAADSPPSC